MLDADADPVVLLDQAPSHCLPGAPPPPLLSPPGSPLAAKAKALVAAAALLHAAEQDEVADTPLVRLDGGWGEGTGSEGVWGIAGAPRPHCCTPSSRQTRSR